MDTQPDNEVGASHAGRPRLFGPRRRWWVLVAWAACLVGILLAQRLTVGTFQTGHWSPSGNTPPTTEELLWYDLPLVLIIATGVLFSLAVRWLIPETGSRKVIRAWGLWLCLPALLASLALSLFYSVVYFYMD
ncbi:MAG: hypothetical protein NTV86_11510 [Planctomycetota bacterium]|nr:hypothetical protein [Planctomycetota bacterium]